MIDLKLEIDEGIILQTTEVERYGTKEQSLDEMILTNQNIICVYKKSNGLFSKPDTIVEKIPLSSIKVINGQAQAMIHNDDNYGKGIQIIFEDRKREFFSLSSAPRKEMPIWVNAINKAIVGENDSVTTSTFEDAYILQEDAKSKEKKSILGNFVGALNVDVQGVIEKVQAKIAEFTENIDGRMQSAQEEQGVENNKTSESPQQPVQVLTEGTAISQVVENTVEASPILQTKEQVENKHTFCSNCGTKLNENAKFCHGCGAAVGTVMAETQSTQTPSVIPPEEKRSERQQEYVGKILKCPHCGGTLTEITAVCYHCGIPITKKEAIITVQEFKNQLMNIENSRKKKTGGIFAAYQTIDEADRQKLTLIRNFPIPNSIDDIVEFMMLAIANIDVSLSKKTFTNALYSTNNLNGETAATIERTISNAWVSKMEQCYRKAEVAFPEHPVFTTIQRAYNEKITELQGKSLGSAFFDMFKY